MDITKIILTSLLISTIAFSQTSVAVVEFEGKGVTKQEASALTDRFRDELFKSGRFQVMERAYMEQILKEQGFQTSGCTSNECMVEVGQLVAVEIIVGGSISKIGAIYSISARMISVESGKILNVSNYDFQGDISGLMTDGMRNVVSQLISGKTVEQRTSVSTSSLYITSNPSGALIYIDGNKISGSTPNMIDNLSSGEHRVILQSGNFTTDTTLMLEPYDVKKIHLTLQKGFGKLKVVTTPFEAKIFIDNIEKGISPALIKDIISGKHQVKITKEGFLSVEMPVDINYNEVKEIQVFLKKPAILILKSTPDNVFFEIGEKYKGTTNDSLQVEDGKYRIRCSKADYYSYESDLSLKEGETREINVNLKHQIGSLEINSSPSGAEVTFNGNKIGITPVKLNSFVTGTYSLNVTKENLTIDTTIQIIADVNNRYNLKLQRGFGYLKVKTSPAGANVFVDDEEKGLSPLTIKALAGTPQVKVKKIGYSEVKQPVSINLKDTTTVSLNLNNKSLLNINSIQDGVYIQLNEYDLGYTPVSLFLEPGQYSIEAFINSYHSLKDTLFIETQSVKTIILKAYPDRTISMREPEIISTPTSVTDISKIAKPKLEISPLEKQTIVVFTILFLIVMLTFS